jgi:hypothetical protein
VGSDPQGRRSPAGRLWRSERWAGSGAIAIDLEYEVGGWSPKLPRNDRATRGVRAKEGGVSHPARAIARGVAGGPSSPAPGLRQLDWQSFEDLVAARRPQGPGAVSWFRTKCHPSAPPFNRWSRAGRGSGPTTGERGASRPLVVPVDSFDCRSRQEAHGRPRCEAKSFSTEVGLAVPRASVGRRTCAGSRGVVAKPRLRWRALAVRGRESGFGEHCRGKALCARPVSPL